MFGRHFPWQSKCGRIQMKNPEEEPGAAHLLKPDDLSAAVCRDWGIRQKHPPAYSPCLSRRAVLLVSSRWGEFFPQIKQMVWIFQYCESLPWLSTFFFFSVLIRDKEENPSSVGCAFCSAVFLLSYCSTLLHSTWACVVSFSAAPAHKYLILTVKQW